MTSACHLGKIFALLQASDYGLELFLGLFACLLVSSGHTEQDVARMHFFLFADLLDGIVIDFVHRFVGERLLADRLQHPSMSSFFRENSTLRLNSAPSPNFLSSAAFETRIMSATNWTR